MSNRWPLSHELYLRINYGKVTYKKMRKWMRGQHSVKAISNKAVCMGISNKRNWSEDEIRILKSCPLKESSEIIGRSENACKIKKSRLCIR